MTGMLSFTGPRRVAVFGGMALATVLLGVTAANAQVAPTPFDCPTDGILVQSRGGAPSQVWFVDMASGTQTTGPTLSTDVNGIGYNIHDGLIYGFDITNGGLIRFGANGELEPLTTPPQLAGVKPPIGDVDEQGHLWTIIGGGNTWAEVDVTVDPPTFVDSGPVTGDGIETYARLIDWSYVPGTDSLYAVARPPDNSKAVLFRFDRTSHDFHRIADLGNLGSVNAFGATYADPDGFLYAGNNNTGSIWRIDVERGTPLHFANGQPSQENDGARCFTAPIPIDFGDAPDAYATLVESDGARHSVDGFASSTSTAPLMLGSTVSIEPEGQPAAGANADTFEEGVSEPITMVQGQPLTITVSVTNTSDEQATLAGWIDVDGSRSFDPGERSNIRTIPASSGTQTYELTFPAASTTDDTYARFRVYGGDVDDPSPVGEALGGGVEDYLVQVIGGPAIRLRKSADTDELVAGNTITYTFEATNTGDEPLDDVLITDTAFAGAGELSDLECDQPTSLDPGQELTCTATYDVQQADVDAGFIRNEANVVGTGRLSGEAVNDQASAQVPSVFAPGIALSKSASPTRAAVGDTITYMFEATNTGDVTLSDVEIDDTQFSGAGRLSDLRCSRDQPATLAPGETLECTATYVVRRADAGAGGITNVATASGNVPGGGLVTGGDSAEASVTPPHHDPGRGPTAGALARTGFDLPSIALLAACLLASAGLVVGHRLGGNRAG